jgi:hypothetical protein
LEKRDNGKFGFGFRFRFEDDLGNGSWEVKGLGFGNVEVFLDRFGELRIFGGRF